VAVRLCVANNGSEATGAGKVVDAAVRRRSAWPVPLFGSGHRPVGPTWFLIFPVYPKLAQL
jgi:hypothetical protein